MLKALREEHQIMSGMNEVGYRALAVLEDTADNVAHGLAGSKSFPQSSHC